MSSFFGSEGKMNIFPSSDRGQYSIFDGRANVVVSSTIDSSNQSPIVPDLNFQDVGERWDLSQGLVVFGISWIRKEICK